MSCKLGALHSGRHEGARRGMRARARRGGGRRRVAAGQTAAGRRGSRLAAGPWQRARATIVPTTRAQQRRAKPVDKPVWLATPPGLLLAARRRASPHRGPRSDAVERAVPQRCPAARTAARTARTRALWATGCFPHAAGVRGAASDEGQAHVEQDSHPGCAAPAGRCPRQPPVSTATPGPHCPAAARMCGLPAGSRLSG